jgi:hypothetical protein
VPRCSWDLPEDGVAARAEEGGHGASVAVTAAPALCAALDTAATEMRKELCSMEVFFLGYKV